MTTPLRRLVKRVPGAVLLYRWIHQPRRPVCIDTPIRDGLRLNLGCGMYHLDGFVNVDEDPAVNPDLVCDALELPFEGGSVDEIYVGHMLEHLDWRDGQRALRYWRGLLSPGGVIGITVPDYDVLVKRYADAPSPEALREMNDLYIYSYRQRSPHRYAYSAALLESAMRDAGFKDLQRLPVDHPYFPAPVDWQVGFRGTR